MNMRIMFARIAREEAKLKEVPLEDTARAILDALCKTENALRRAYPVAEGGDLRCVLINGYFDLVDVARCMRDTANKKM